MLNTPMNGMRQRARATFILFVILLSLMSSSLKEYDVSINNSICAVTKPRSNVLHAFFNITTG
jgi:hypothetical protein